ncbi:MAG TPA: response regulator [Candidatus Nitrosocosmicus sp.]|nr:response regulator [Candidatus Nitrosocosmicus sp.]
MSVQIPKNKHARNSQSIEKIEDKIQILIAESEDELLELFDTYISLLGMNTEIANSGEKAMDCFFGSIKKNRPYDAIIVDTHLTNPSGLDVAKRIRKEMPDQKIVIVTTSPKEYLPAECLETAGIKDKDILTMPFRISKLGLVLEN